MEHFNQLSPAEAERLALLSEELGEAQQAIGKILRHGQPSMQGVNLVARGLRDLFKVGDSFPVSDWSEVEEGAPAPEESGVLIIKSVQSTPQSFEKQSGIRLMQVQAQMISYGED